MEVGIEEITEQATEVAMEVDTEPVMEIMGQDMEEVMGQATEVAMEVGMEEITEQVTEEATAMEEATAASTLLCQLTTKRKSHSVIGSNLGVFLMEEGVTATDPISLLFLTIIITTHPAFGIWPNSLSRAWPNPCLSLSLNGYHSAPHSSTEEATVEAIDREHFFNFYHFVDASRATANTVDHFNQTSRAQKCHMSLNPTSTNTSYYLAGRIKQLFVFLTSRVCICSSSRTSRSSKLVVIWSGKFKTDNICV